MSLRLYLFFMSLGTLLCWMAWFFVMKSFLPAEAGFIGFTLFYVSLFLATVGTISVIGFLIRSIVIKNEDIVFRHVRHTFRQGVLVASFLVVLLVLQGGRLLAWWNVVVLAAFFALLEGVIFTKRKFNGGEYVK